MREKQSADWEIKLKQNTLNKNYMILKILLAISVSAHAASKVQIRQALALSAGSLRHPINEGFNPKPFGLTLKLKEIWNQTYMIAFEDPQAKTQNLIGIGSAFLVDTQPTNTNELRLIFATNKHVVGSRCLQTVGLCAGGTLYRDAAVAISTDHQRSWVQPDGLRFFGRPFRVRSYLRATDLALIETTVPSNMAPDFTPVPLADPETAVNRVVFHIGHPAIYEYGKSAWNDEPVFLFKKQWSSGLMLDKDERQRGLMWTVLTMADAYPGDSGGPTASLDGVIGITSMITSSYQNPGWSAWIDMESWYQSYFSFSTGILNYLGSYFGVAPWREIPYNGRWDTVSQGHNPHTLSLSTHFLRQLMAQEPIVGP